MNRKFLRNYLVTFREVSTDNKPRINYESIFLGILVVACIAIALLCTGCGDTRDTQGNTLAEFKLDEDVNTDPEDEPLVQQGRKWCLQTIECFFDKGIITESDVDKLIADLPNVKVKLVSGRSQYKDHTLIIDHEWYTEARAQVVRHEFSHHIDRMTGADEHDLFDFRNGDHWNSKCQ